MFFFLDGRLTLWERGAYSEPLRCLKEHGGVGIPAIQIMGTGSDPRKRYVWQKMLGSCGYWVSDVDCVGLAYPIREDGKGKDISENQRDS